MWIHTSTFCNICIYRYCVSPLLLHRFNLVLVHKIKKLIKQVKSRIGAPADQKRTLDALGLRKLNRVVEHESTPSILGMVDKVKHLVAIVK